MMTSWLEQAQELISQHPRRITKYSVDDDTFARAVAVVLANGEYNGNGVFREHTPFEEIEDIWELASEVTAWFVMTGAAPYRLNRRGEFLIPMHGDVFEYSPEEWRWMEFAVLYDEDRAKQYQSAGFPVPVV